MPLYNVANILVSTLLSNIQSEVIAIPEMQRPFVWDAAQVRDLIDSLYKGFPVGYIIEWQNPDIRLKDGTSSMGKRILIDGQQRVTAMAAAIVGQEVMNKHYKWVRIKIAFNPIDEKFEVANSAINKSDAWIPDISSVFKIPFNSFDFVIDYCAKNKIPDKQSRINNVINRLLAIQNSSIGVISLGTGLEIDDVTQIFIRINSKGTVLSQADFAMSKISSNEAYGGNITRKTIDYFCHLLESPEDLKDIKKNDTDFAYLPEFGAIEWAAHKNSIVYQADYTDILRVAFIHSFNRGRLADLVSLLSGRDFKTREFRQDIEEASYKQLHGAVLNTVNKTNFERFLMIVDSVGIVKKSLVRSQNALNFSYALYLCLKERKTDSVKTERTVRRWLILSILTGRYSGSPESMFDYDIKRFYDADDPEKYLRLTEAGELSDAFWNVTLLQKLDTSVASSPYFNLYLMAQVKDGDRGFLSEQIEVKSMLDNRGDIHHIFPKNYLVKNGIQKSQYNQIANYAFVQQEINIRIKDAAPCEYMSDVYRQCDTKQPVYGGITDKDALKENLEMNCVPGNLHEMDVKDYPRFLEERRRLMAAKIRKYYEGL